MADNVALLTEGVDRNYWTAKGNFYAKLSPSSRRAWIEIKDWIGRRFGHLVALLTEGVDRN